MKTLPSILLASICALLCGCGNFSWSGPSSVKGSGKIASETRAVSQFDRVRLSGSGHLTIAQGDVESLTIEADDNLLPLIKSEVSGGTLRIGPENVNLSPTRSIRYNLQLKNLNELDLSGALQAQAPSLKSDHLVVAISGSGKVQIPKLETGDLTVKVSGSGDIEMAGKADRQTIQISGSGKFLAGDCESQNTTVHVSGSGDATVWAHLALEARVSGSGDIRYYGTPQLNSHVSGSGAIRSLGNK
jgi:hypothetical protein